MIQIIKNIFQGLSIQKITEELNQAFIFVVMTKNKGQTMPDFALNILQYFLFIF